MATVGNRVAKNAAWIIGCRIVQSVLSLVISMLTARYLGPSNYGLISYASSIVSFVIPIMHLGLSGTLVREIIDNPEQEGRILGTSLCMSVVSSLFCMMGVTSFAMLVNANETDTIIVCTLYSFVLPAQAVEMIQYWYQAKLKSKYVSITSLVVYVIISAYKIFLLVSKKSIYWFAVSNAIDFALIGVILLAIYISKKNPKLSFSFLIAKKLFSKSRYYIISSMMVTIFAQTDRIMLKLMVNDATAGYYSAAVACAGITSFVFTAIIDSMRPVIFQSKNIDNVSYEKSITSLYSIIIYLSLAQSVVMTAFAPLIVNVLYGSAYLPSIGMLQVLVWYTTFSYLGSVRNVWMLAESKQKYLWIINLSGACTNVILNVILIPVMGGVGAALASLATQMFTNVIIGFLIRPIIHNNRLMFNGLNPIPLLKSGKQIIKKIRKEGR